MPKDFIEEAHDNAVKNMALKFLPFMDFLDSFEENMRNMSADQLKDAMEKGDKLLKKSLNEL